MSQSVSQRLRALTHRPVLRYTCIGVLSLILLYGLFGFFILPRIIQSQARQYVAEKFHRNLSIERIEINPFSLQATIHDLKLMEPQGGKVFVGFQALTVKVSPKSILHLAPVVQEVLLSKPTVHLVRRDANHYNVDDIVAALASPTPAPPSQQPARFSVNNIQLEDGQIEFEDTPVGATQVVSELKLGIPFISSFPAEEEIFVVPSLSARINGAPLQLNGKARPYAEPRDASLALNLDDIDLTRYLEYLPFHPHFKLPSAKLDIHLNANFQQLRDKAPALLLSGTAKLKSLQLMDANNKQVLGLEQLQVILGSSDVFGEHFNLSHIVLEGITANLTREPDGQLNLQQLLETEDQNRAETPSATPVAASVAAQAPKSQPASPAKSFHLDLDDLAIHNAAVHYVDQQASQAIRADVEKFDLTVARTDLDLSKHRVTVGEISSNDASFMLNLGKRTASAAAPIKSPGNASRASPNGHARSRVEKANSQDRAAPEEKDEFIVDIDKIAIDNWTAHIEDHSLAHAVMTDLGPVKLNMQGISSTANALSQIDLRTAINHSGQLAINGKLGLRPFHGDLNFDIKSVDLLGLQPYVTDQVNLLLTSANLSAKGVLKLDHGNGNALGGGFKGDFKLENVATVDKLSSDDFLRWKSLAFGGVDIKFAPLAVNIDQITLGDFFARVIIDPTGHINLQDIASSNTAGQKSLTTDTGSASTTKGTAIAKPSTPPAAPQATASSTSNGSAVPVKIGKLIMQGGKVRYTDNFIKPHYTANLMNIGGSVSGLSSDANSRANVDLHGQVNDAPLTIAGSINPLKSDLSLDIKANVKGMELAPLSPYSGRYIGYGIEKGKLSFEVAYQIEQRKLTAQNRLILDQLTFGEKIDSPVATKLPVQFAVALLRDRNGVIDVNLPIGGSLDDPDFSVGGIVFKVIVNVIAKAVTEPFALLGSLFGGGQEMSTMAFDSGSAVVITAGESKLKALATALTERPALKLEITGFSDPDADRSGLQHAALLRKLRAIKAKDLGAHGTLDTTSNITINPDEYPALLKRAYQAETFTKPRNALGFAKDLPVSDMESLMLQNAPISNDDLTALGNRRSQAAKDWLTSNGKIPAERLFIMASKSGAAVDDKKAPSAHVDFSLR